MRLVRRRSVVPTGSDVAAHVSAAFLFLAGPKRGSVEPLVSLRGGGVTWSSGGFVFCMQICGIHVHISKYIYLFMFVNECYYRQCSAAGSKVHTSVQDVSSAGDRNLSVLMLL